MQWNVGNKIAIVFGVAIAIFVVVGITSYRATTQLGEDGAQRSQSYTLLLNLLSVQNALSTAEGAQRSYILTGDAGFRNEFMASAAELDENLGRLKKAAAEQERHR